MKQAIVWALVALVLLATSCTSGTEGIFASLEREQKIVSLGGLSKVASVTSMAELSGKYYATGGRGLFSKSVSATTWDSSTVNGNTEVAAVGVAGTKVFAVAGGVLYSSPDGSTWSAVSGLGADLAFDLVPIRKGNQTSTELLLVTSTSGAYQNVYIISNTGTLGSAVTLGASPWAAPVTACIDDGTNHYAASESHLWNLASPGSPVVVSGAPQSGYTGLVYLSAMSGTTGYFVSTRSNNSTGGGIYFGTSIGTLTTTIVSNAQTSILPVEPISFGSFLYNATNASLWVASGASTSTQGTGYSEVTLPSSFSATPTTDSNNYTSSSIKYSSVGSFFQASNGTYYLGTIAHGLWAWNTSNRTWSQQ